MSRITSTSSVHAAFGIFLACALAVASGCSTKARPSFPIHDSPRASVGLETWPRGSLRATQPVSLAESTVAQVLSGVMVRKEQRLLKTLLAGEAKAEPAIDPEEVALLAPHVTEALRRAGADDLVRFEARRMKEAGEEATGGALYVKDGAIVFALTHYRAPSAQPSGAGKASPGYRRPAGMPQRTISFSPPGIEVPHPAPPPDVLATGEFRVMALDFTLLAKLQKLESASAAGASPSKRISDGGTKTGADEETLKDLVIQKELEIKALRQELQSLRRQLKQSR